MKAQNILITLSLVVSSWTASAKNKSLGQKLKIPHRPLPVSISPAPVLEISNSQCIDKKGFKAILDSLQLERDTTSPKEYYGKRENNHWKFYNPKIPVADPTEPLDSIALLRMSKLKGLLLKKYPNFNPNDVDFILVSKSNINKITPTDQNKPVKKRMYEGFQFYLKIKNRIVFSKKHNTLMTLGKSGKVRDLTLSCMDIKPYTAAPRDKRGNTPRKFKGKKRKRWLRQKVAKALHHYFTETYPRPLDQKGRPLIIDSIVPGKTMDSYTHTIVGGKHLLIPTLTVRAIIHASNKKTRHKVQFIDYVHIPVQRAQPLYLPSTPPQEFQLASANQIKNTARKRAPSKEKVLIKKSQKRNPDKVQR